MTQLSRLLQDVQSPPALAAPAEQEQPVYHHPQVGRCNYDDFCRLRDQAPAAARAHFTEMNFLKVRCVPPYICIDACMCTRTCGDYG